MLIEEELTPTAYPLTTRAKQLIDAGQSSTAGKACFEFIPSDYEYVWSALSSFTPCRFCEWGSGLGIVTGMAELLGFTACGIELDRALADASRQMLRNFGLHSPIIHGDYMTTPTAADLVFAYVWPGKRAATEARFVEVAPSGAQLMLSFGASAIDLKTLFLERDDR